MRSRVELQHRLPQHARPHLEPRGDDRRGAARRGLRDVRGRQVAPVPDGGRLGGRPVRPVAVASGASTATTASSTARPTSSIPSSSTTTTGRPAAGPSPRATTSARTWSTTRSRSCTTRSRSARTGRSSSTSRSGAMHAPHQAPPSTSRSTAGAFDEGWDVARRGLVRAAAVEIGPVPAEHRARAAQPGRRAVGRAAREPAPLAARLQEAFAGFLDHTDAQIGRLIDDARAPRRARQHPDRAAVRQRRQPGGRPVRRPARVEVLQLHRRDARRGGRTASTTSAARTATPTTRGAGPRPATRRSSGTSRTPTRAACTCR